MIDTREFKYFCGQLRGDSKLSDQETRMSPRVDSSMMDVKPAKDQAHEVRDKPMAFIKLNHFTQQPAWLRDNHFLHNNHRAPTQSYVMCLRSCFMLHTETMNIW